jgi:hypothetical protein
MRQFCTIIYSYFYLFNQFIHFLNFFKKRLIMTTIIKIKAIAMKTLMLFLVMNLAFACSETKTPTTEATTPPVATAQPVAATTQPSAETTATIMGVVMKITMGKDGYVANVNTDAEDSRCDALVSISNLGGPDNYKTCNVSDHVSFKGVLSSDGKSMMVKEIISIKPTAELTTITAMGYRGIILGDAIKKHGAYVKKSTMNTGEGSFEVYKITDKENNPAGYLMADSKNKLLVGSITVESTKARTEEGIKVGSTFKDLLKAFPNIEVHGSEIESRTYAKAGNLSYRLDVANNTYEVDKAKIKPTTKITEIVISGVRK